MLIGFSGRMPKIEIKVPNDLKEKMNDHRNIDWDELIQMFIKNYLFKIELADSIASKSEMTPEDAIEIGDDIKRGIAERHGLVK